MMRISKEKGARFLEEMSKPISSKNQIFDALFEACGVGENLNTKHVFFQDVIIKFNASKAATIIAKHLPHETESHYIDVALYAYIKAGFPMKDFDRDLAEMKSSYNFMYTPLADGAATFANA